MTAVAWVGRAGRALGVPEIPGPRPGLGGTLGCAAAIRRAHVQIALVADADELPAIAWALTLGGVRAALLFPGPVPRNLPWIERRFHRFVLPDQEQARVWGRSGIALGRIVVIAPGAHEQESLEAIFREVRAMHGVG